MGTARRDDPTGLGRIIRDADGQFQAIVEQRDATPEQAAVNEVNMSTYLFRRAAFAGVARSVAKRQCAGRILRDRLPRLATSRGASRTGHAGAQEVEALSINNLQDLSAVESAMRSLGGE